MLWRKLRSHVPWQEKRESTPASCLGDFGDTDLSLFSVSAEEALVEIAAAVAIERSTLDDVFCLLFEEATLAGAARAADVTRGRTLIEAVNGNHRRLTDATATEVYQLVTALYETIDRTEEGSSTAEGLRVVTKQEIREVIERWRSAGSLPESKGPRWLRTSASPD